MQPQDILAVAIRAAETEQRRTDPNGYGYPRYAEVAVDALTTQAIVDNAALALMRNGVEGVASAQRLARIVLMSVGDGAS